MQSEVKDGNGAIRQISEAAKRLTEATAWAGRMGGPPDDQMWPELLLDPSEVMDLLAILKHLNAQTDGITRIAAERQRQVASEGWTPAHDDTHSAGQLADAAVCYAKDECDRCPSEHGIAPYEWPWSNDWWKPSPADRIRELDKAGALIAAEIERLLRLAAREEGGGEDE